MSAKRSLLRWSASSPLAGVAQDLALAPEPVGVGPLQGRVRLGSTRLRQDGGAQQRHLRAEGVAESSTTPRRMNQRRKSPTRRCLSWKNPLPTQKTSRTASGGGETGMVILCHQRCPREAAGESQSAMVARLRTPAAQQRTCRRRCGQDGGAKSGKSWNEDGRGSATKRQESGS